MIVCLNPEPCLHCFTSAWFQQDGSDIQDSSPDPHQPQGDGTLRGPNPSHNAGESALTIFIEKWGFKDVGIFSDPRVVISVRDGEGNVLEALQVMNGMILGTISVVVQIC